MFPEIGATFFPDETRLADVVQLEHQQPGPRVRTNVGQYQIGMYRAVFGMLDELNPEYLVDPQDLVHISVAKGVILGSIDHFLGGGSNARRAGVGIDVLPGYTADPDRHPLAVVVDAMLRAHLRPIPAANSLDAQLATFIPNADERRTVVEDIDEIKHSIADGAWKGATILGGSVIEALLLQALQNKLSAAQLLAAQNAATTSHPGVQALNTPIANLLDRRWTLQAYTILAQEAGLIDEADASVCHKVRSYRNLVHPALSSRTGQRCDEPTARLAHATILELVKKFG